MVDNVSVSNIPAAQKWNIDEIKDWIQHVVHNLLCVGAQISDAQDLFVVGVDRSAIHFLRVSTFQADTF